jgi:hypothetical protein
MLKARFVRPLIAYNKVQGTPFTSEEVLDKIDEILEGR